MVLMWCRTNYLKHFMMMGDSAMGCQPLKQDGEDFFRSKNILVRLKHVGTTAWHMDVLKMSVRTSVSSSGHSFSTQIGMLSGPSALRSLIFERYFQMLAGHRDRTWSSVRGDNFCAVHLRAVSCFKVKTPISVSTL